MPPEVDTIAMISEETAGKLAELVARNNLKSMGEVSEYAADHPSGPETLSDADLARLLYHQLTDAD